MDICRIDEETVQKITGDKVRHKKYFYALRPLMASMYIEEKHMALVSL